jgi:lipopolysaccharide biosynthesis glycosyltransferase
MPLATALRSIADSNPMAWPLGVYILSGGFSEGTKRKITGSLPKASTSIHWVPLDLTPFSRFSTVCHISITTYARLLLSSILPTDITRVLYLDADLLVLDDLAPICTLDLDGAVLGAIVDDRLDKHIKMGNTTLHGGPLPRVRAYFNAGVLLIDLAKWRSERIDKKAMQYLEHCPNSLYSDQDALNFACDGLWKRVDPRWNYYQIDLKGPISDLSGEQRPGIIHFQGGLKPWDPKSLNVNAEFYDNFRSRTLFATTRWERVSNVPLMIWSSLKRVLKQSATFNSVWRRLKTRDRRKPSRRLAG